MSNIKNGQSPARIGLVLSAGGLRGAAHLGVLRRLLQAEVPIDLMVGVSAGAIIAAYYAAVGLTVDELIRLAEDFRGRHIIMHGLTLRAAPWAQPWLRRFCGVIPERLRQLDEARFDRLHHGVRALGIVCHELRTNRPVYFVTGRRHLATLAEAVKASAAIPGVIPARTIERRGEKVCLVDGGISDPLPVDFARSDGLGATHVIVSDCCSRVPEPPVGNNVVYMRPELDDVGALRSPRATLLRAVAAGEAAVTPAVLRRIKSWMEKPAGARP